MSEEEAEDNAATEETRGAKLISFYIHICISKSIPISKSVSIPRSISIYIEVGAQLMWRSGQLLRPYPYVLCT